jgi:hypothetical protein
VVFEERDFVGVLGLLLEILSLELKLLREAPAGHSVN